VSNETGIHGQSAARIRALVEGVDLGSFNLVFTEFETHAVRAYSQMASKALQPNANISTEKSS
jgi:hypothetical protein